MTTKLTLSIGTEPIKKAKRISRRQGTSVSRLVENFLQHLPDTEEQRSSAVVQLRGIGGSASAARFNWKKIKAGKLRRKHGL